MSSNHEISPRARQFIVDHIDSVMELELLLAAAAERPDADWSFRDMAATLRIADEGWVDARLRRMAARGLIAPRGGPPPQRYAYAPGTPELAETVGEVAQAYAERRVTVIGLIFSKPIDKLMSFADAFRIR